MRLQPLVAVVPLLVAVYACTTTDAEPPSSPADASSPTDASTPATDAVDVTTVILDAGTEDAEAGPCVAPPVSTDLGNERCYPAGSCPTCADGIRYTCAGSGQPEDVARNPIACRKVKAGEYCCPATCVRSVGYASRCADAGADGGAMVAYACPAAMNGDLTVGLPATCKRQPFGPDPSAATPFVVACCD